MADVTVEGLTKRFGAATALDAVSLSIPDGSFVALLGPSGCGKTTFLRLLAGLETPSAGRIRIGGVDVTAFPPERRGLGMMFQSYALFPHMTVAENLRFPLRMRNIGAPEEQAARVAEALHLVRLDELGARFPRQLSGGQQQRVALARALIADPPVLLLDEPLSNLDAQLRRDMQVELIELHHKIGLTTVLVTHDQDEALSLADVVVLMRAGQIEQIGSPRHIYRRPATIFAARFLGAANVVRVQVARGQAMLAPGILVPAPGARDGERHLVLRQEELRLDATRGAEEVSVPAQVVAVAFHGASLRIVVQVGAHRLSLLAPAGVAPSWNSGDLAQLCWPLEAGILL